MSSIRVKPVSGPGMEAKQSPAADADGPAVAIPSFDLNAVSPLSRSVGPRQRNVLVMPPNVKMNEDKSFELPTSWEYRPEWALRNDVDDLVAHNLAVQLSKSKMIESRTDLDEQLSSVRWNLSKLIGAVLMVARVLLNGFSATTNVVQLPPRDSSEDYNLAQYIVFIFEASAVGLQILVCVTYLLVGMSMGCHMRKKLRNVKDPITGEPFHGTFRTRRRQSWYLKWSSSFLERAASFSVLKYLPSVQVVQSLIGNRHEFIFAAKLRYTKIRGYLKNHSKTVAIIGGLLLFPLLLVGVLLVIAVYVGPYILSPIAFVVKLRFQVNFVVTTFWEDWTFSQWLLLSSFINSVASMVNPETIRQDMVLDYVTTGPDAKYDKSEVWMRSELETFAYLSLWKYFGSIKAYFIWISLDSKDLQRMTKKAGPPVQLQVLSRAEAARQGIHVVRTIHEIEAGLPAGAKDDVDVDTSQKGAAGKGAALFEGIARATTALDTVPGMREREPADRRETKESGDGDEENAAGTRAGAGSGAGAGAGPQV